MTGTSSIANPGFAQGRFDRFDRSIVRLAGVLSALAALAFVVAGTVGERGQLVHAIGPGLVAVTAGLQTVYRRERLAAILVLSAIVVIMQVGLIGAETSAVAAALGLSVIGMTGSLTVRRRLRTYLVGYSALLLGAVLWWSHPDLAGAVIPGLTTAVSFVFGSLIFWWLRRELFANAARYSHLFGRAPVSLWQEDFSAVGTWLDRLRSAGVTDLEEYLDANPGAILDGARLVRVDDANDAAISLVEATEASDIIGPLPEHTFTEATLKSLVPQFLAIWRNEDRAVTEVVEGRTLNGRPFHALLYWSAPRVAGRLDLANVTVAIVDVTTIREAEAHLQNLLRAKDEFVASVSHELRTPLTTVVGLSEELREGPERFDTAEVYEFLDLISGQALEASTIVEDLLVAAQTGAGTVTVNIEDIDPDFETRCVVKALGLDDRIEVEQAGVSPAVLGDPGRVRQIIRNLLVNAQRYGGDRIRIRLVGDEASCTIEVRDSGKPLPAHQREAIFDRYFKAKQVKGLTASVGLGLTVSRELARLMGGDLRYDHDGFESIFALTLPRPG